MKQFGLTDKQAEESRQKYGDNSMTEQASESFWDKLKGNLGDPMIKILIVALLINVVLAVLGGVGIIKEGAPEWYEPLGIFVAIALATLVSTFSEYRNENAFQKLQEEASRIMCKVYRNGEIAEVAINDIVVGDAILLQSGDKVPADGIIIDGDIKADQSVLNGESREAKKLAVPEGWKDTDESLNFDNEHKVFRGSVVCSGNAVMEVTVVGDKSVYGKIASELQTDDDRETPLKVKLGKLADGISKFGYIGGIAIGRDAHKDAVHGRGRHRSVPVRRGSFPVGGSARGCYPVRNACGHHHRNGCPRGTSADDRDSFRAEHGQDAQGQRACKKGRRYRDRRLPEYPVLR